MLVVVVPEVAVCVVGVGVGHAAGYRVGAVGDVISNGVGPDTVTEHFALD